MDDQASVSQVEAYMNMHRRIQGQGEPAFEDPVMQEKVWGNNWGLNNDVGQLRKVLVHRPGKEWDVMKSEGEYVPEMDALLGPDYMWYWKGKERPDIDKVQAQHDNLTEALKAEGVEIVEVVEPLPHLTKTIYTRDTAVIVKGGQSCADLELTIDAAKNSPLCGHLPESACRFFIPSMVRD